MGFVKHTLNPDAKAKSHSSFAAKAVTAMAGNTVRLTNLSVEVSRGAEEQRGRGEVTVNSFFHPCTPAPLLPCLPTRVSFLSEPYCAEGALLSETLRE